MKRRIQVNRRSHSDRGTILIDVVVVVALFAMYWFVVAVSMHCPLTAHP